MTRYRTFLTTALVAVAAQACRQEGFGVPTGTGSGGAAGQVVGGASGTGGAAGAGGTATGGTGGAAIAGADVSGRWAMFAFEDPVAVSLTQADSALGGFGCCAGLPQVPTGGCCGVVTGQLVGRRVTLGLTTDGSFGPFSYSTDGFASADGQRMVGTLSAGVPPISPSSLLVAWVRIGPTDPWLPNWNPALAAVIRARNAAYALALSSDPPAGNDFSAQRTYQLTVRDRFLYGDFGAYWEGEMSWNESEQTLVVGPVPETAPDLPVALSLRFDGVTLASVEAAMASGARYRFNATASQP